MTDKRKSFVGGAAVLAVAGVLGKVVAAFYRVWLNALIGPEGLGIYQIPSNFYAFLLVISSAGIPTAISKLVSENVAKNNEVAAKQTFIAARRVLLITGTVATVLMALLARPLSNIAGEPEAFMGFIALSPSLLVVCLLSAYRGYFQGWQRMSPTAVSQIIEQIGRLAFGFGFAVLWYPRGAAWGAAGAVFGVTLCEIAALAFISGSYTAHKRRVDIKAGKIDFKPIARRIFAIAIPVTIGASIMPIVGLTDTMTVINRLTAAGFDSTQATATFGIFNGMVQSIINMPSVITLALSISLVPAISQAIAVKDKNHAQTAKTGVKLASLIGFPCALGIFLLADPIMSLLSPVYTAQQHALAANLLSIMAFSIIFLSFNQTTTGILQGYGRPMLPVKSLATGAVVKIILNYVLIAIPEINIMGAAISSLACYAIATVMNMTSVVKVSGMKLEFGKTVLLPLLSALGMAAAVVGVRLVCGNFLGEKTTLAISVVAGVAVYAVLALVTKAISRQELAMIPGGGRAIRLLVKLGVYK